MKNYLMHHGIPGQKWGLRRFQNEDGTYTEEGKARERARESKARDDENSSRKLNVVDKKMKTKNGELKKWIKSMKKKSDDDTISISGQTKKDLVNTFKKRAEKAKKEYDKTSKKSDNKNELTEEQLRKKAEIDKKYAPNAKNNNISKEEVLKVLKNQNVQKILSDSGSKIFENALNSRETKRQAKALSEALNETKNMDNKQLQDFITRRNLEQKYASLRSSELKGKKNAVDSALSVGKFATKNAQTILSVAEFIKYLRENQ